MFCGFLNSRSILCVHCNHLHIAMATCRMCGACCVNRSIARLMSNFIITATSTGLFLLLLSLLTTHTHKRARARARVCVCVCVCGYKDNNKKRKWSRYSSVGIATRYGLDGPGIESWWGRDFSHLSRPALRPIQHPIQWVPGLSWE